MVFRAAGTKGTIEFIFKAGVNIGPGATSSLTLYKEGYPPTEVKADPGDAYGGEISYFAKCIEEDTEPFECLPEDCREVTAMLVGVIESIETGKSVKL
jgi:predicted dehydrogenase